MSLLRRLRDVGWACVLRDVTDRVLRGLTGERVCEREAVGQAVL